MSESRRRIRSVLRRALKWIVPLAIVAFVAWRLKFAPVPVLAHPVGGGVIVAEVLGTGTLEARVETTISTRLQERLAEVPVDQGDTVTAGQLLARLDDAELRRQVEVAGAGLAAARATAERVKTDEARALAVANQARRFHRRVSDLLEKAAASVEDLDKALESVEIAEADMARARTAIEEAQSQVATAEKNLAYQEERLGFTRITSPYDGLVVRRDRDPGGVVVPGSAIVQLISTGEIWVSAWVDETALAALAPGQPARVVFRSEPETSYPGEVSRLGREADRETRELLVDVLVKSLPKNWAVGQRAEVFVETGRKEAAVVVPAAFVSWRAGRPGVIAERNGKALWREVALGLRGRDSVEVAEGLAAGEVVCRPRPGGPPVADGQRIALP